jgi:hypothetical protein
VSLLANVAKAAAGLVVDLLAEKLTPDQTARRLVDAALATGLPEHILASYLTEGARLRQEAFFEARKAAKLAGQQT